jgi:hypothetical protein
MSHALLFAGYIEEDDYTKAYSKLVVA